VRGGGQRQREAEACTSIRILRPDAPALCIDDASADRKPHAQTGASGREEGLEQPRQHIRGDARALILDADLSGVGTLRSRPHGDLAPLVRDLGQRMDRVGQQIQEHLLGLDTTGRDGRQRARQRQLDRDPLRVQLVADQPQDLLHQLPELQVLAGVAPSRSSSRR
jgi:hypothetical protein